MTPELSNALAQLAAKLGVSVEILWPTLVAHARLDAISLLVGSSIMAILAFIGATKAIKGGHNSKYDDGAFYFLGALLIVIGIFCFGFALSSISDCIYPQASALQTLLHSVR